jgi:VCBS repeat-containing protein
MSFVLTGNDIDVDGDDVEIASITTTGTLGLVTVNADNDSITYDPNGQFESLAPGETATDTFTYTVTDSAGLMSTATVTVTINGANDPPTNVSAGGPYTVNEGGSVSLSGTFTDIDINDSHTFSWDINGDGTFGDSTAQNPTLTWAQLQLLGINDGPSTFNVSFRVTDQGGPVTSAATTLTVANVAPTAAITGPSFGVLGIPIDFTLTATDVAAADQAANFTFDVDWGDGSVDPLNPYNAASPLVVSHGFQNFGLQTITVTATDKDGGVSAAVTHVIDIVPIAVVGNDLQATGTPSGDVIIFYSSNTGVRVRYNDVVYPTDGTSYSFSGKIVANGEGGSDRIIVAGGLRQEVVFDGGVGND